MFKQPLRLATATLTIALTAIGLTSCGEDPANGGGDSGGGNTAAADQPEVVQVAAKIMACFAKDDAEGMKALLNENNQKMTVEAIAKALPSMKKKLGDATAITEVRKSDGGDMLAKLREEEGETFVLVLTPQGDSFGFEDINSPSTERFNKLEKVWPAK